MLLSLYFSAIFHSTTANKIYSERMRDYQILLPVWEDEILQVTVNKLKFSHLFRLISDNFRIKSAENSY